MSLSRRLERLERRLPPREEEPKAPPEREQELTPGALDQALHDWLLHLNGYNFFRANVPDHDPLRIRFSQAEVPYVWTRRPEGGWSYARSRPCISRVWVPRKEPEVEAARREMALAMARALKEADEPACVDPTGYHDPVPADVLHALGEILEKSAGPEGLPWLRSDSVLSPDANGEGHPAPSASPAGTATS